jgi:hypothetical protein
VTIILEAAVGGSASLPPFPHLHFVYTHRTAPHTHRAAQQTHIVSVPPRVLSRPRDPSSQIDSNASPSFYILGFSISVIVPHCSVLRARVQLHQVRFCIILPLRSVVETIFQFSAQDSHLCDDFLSRSSSSNSSSSSSSDNGNSSSVCSQQLIFNSDIFDLSIPSWGDSGKSNTIVLFPKALATAEAAAALAALERAERDNKEVLAMPAQCRPLEWNSVPPLVDHRAMIAAVAMQQARAN